MKLAISGKGGVGKTTFSALLIRTLNAQGKRVLAIDADPDANLAAALGIPDAEKIVPIAEMKELIFERTEAQPGSIGGFFKLNPKVDDLPDSLSAKLENIKLMRLVKGAHASYRSGQGRGGGHGYGSGDRTFGQSHGLCSG
jgi:CO dehydrogenase maturation factor